MTVRGLSIDNLHVRIGETDILRGVTLEVPEGEVHALMGPNGSGKSTLAYTIMGHPSYTITRGTVSLNGTSLGELSPEERARLGLFLSPQYPTAIPGVTVVNFLRASLRGLGKELPARAFLSRLSETMASLHMDDSFRGRYINDGFSGGEKKRTEILQLALLEPVFAVLDETDSGLDVDALRTVAEGVNRVRTPELGILLITHYNRILEHLKPDVIHLLYKGQIVAAGGPEMAQEIEKSGYAPFIGTGAEPEPMGAHHGN